MSTMKFDSKTLMVLKNFSSINQSLLFTEGDVLMTVAPTKSVLAKAKIDQKFNRQFAIFELPRFIGVMSLFNDPEMDFQEKGVLMRSGDRELEYRYADPSAIISPDFEKISNLKLPSSEVEFTLTAVNLQDIQKALGALGMPEIAVCGDGKNMWLQTFDTKNANGDSYRIKVGTTENKFQFVYKAENLKLIPQEYSVQISKRGLSNFVGNTIVDVNYWITLEAKSSKFEE